MTVFDRCSCEGCKEHPVRIIKSLNAGYCLNHWKDISGNLKSFPVLKIYACEDCKWTFSNHVALERHRSYAHGEII
jgi:hypothetical protein